VAKRANARPVGTYLLPMSQAKGTTMDPNAALENAREAMAMTRS